MPAATAAQPPLPQASVSRAHEAARAVAALLHLAAVGVENAVAKIGAGQARRFNQQDLIATDAKMPVGQAPQLCRGERQAPAHAVQHDEIVARPLHLGERELHSCFSIT